jgi:hypothetical protein
MSFPAAISKPPGAPVYAAKDYAALRERFGDWAVLCSRDPSGAVCAQLASMSIVGLGELGMHMAETPLAGVAEHLSAPELERLRGRELVITCAAPLEPGQASVLADIALRELQRWRALRYELYALDKVLDHARMRDTAEECLRHLGRMLSTYQAAGQQADDPAPPLGWVELYSGGDGGLPADKLNSLIKDHARAPPMLYPPLPPAPPEECRALLDIHDLLVERDFQVEREAEGNNFHVLAGRILEAALANPAFMHIGRDPRLFDPQRDTPLASRWHRFGVGHLTVLMQAETFYGSLPGDGRPAATPNLPFVLTLPEVVAMGAPNLLDAGRALRRLDTFVGGGEWVTGDLDLSRTYITGGSIAASCIMSAVEGTIPPARAGGSGASEPPNAGDLDEKDPGSGLGELAPADARYLEYLALFYPRVKTTPLDQDAYLAVIQVLLHNVGLQPTYKIAVGEGGCEVLTVKVSPPAAPPRVARLDVRSGSDVDLAIDVESNELFDEVVLQHYRAISARAPGVVLRRHLCGKGDNPDRYNWSIMRPGCHRWRAIELYRCEGFGQIMSHHLGMVCGAYTGAFGPPQFVVSARFALSAVWRASAGYTYFASHKSSPLSIITKYLRRGFDLSTFPPVIRTAISQAVHAEYERVPSSLRVQVHTAGVGFHWPALHALEGFSAYSAATEVSIVARLQSRHQISRRRA